MNINGLIFRNLKKNVKNYYLYVFALIFTVSLYFAFVTLQFDPALDEAKGTIKGAAAIRSASIMLIAIVSIFLVYANTIFIKRRSKEIGLFQLIGMTKGKIFRILTVENFFLYFISTIIGIFLGFSISKLILMILFKLTKVDAIATLRFSTEALIQTLLVFCAIYLLILLMNWIFIKKQSILSLFRVRSSTEEKVKKVSIFEMIIGILGIILIIVGYYVSSKLFSGDFVTINELFGAMIFILGSVILGTYLFYKGSVRFIFYLIRKKKDGYLNINQVLSLSSIMFRMKSNALALTIITTVSALAIGFLSLSYISYFSADKNAKDSVPHHFALTHKEDTDAFKKMLDLNHISYSESKIDVLQVTINANNIMKPTIENMNFNPSQLTLAVISDKSAAGIDVAKTETLFSGYNHALSQFTTWKDSGIVEFQGLKKNIPLKFIGLNKDFFISGYFTNGNMPVAIVDETIFSQLKKDINPEIQKRSSTYFGIEVKEKEQLEKADRLFHTLNIPEGHVGSSQLGFANGMKEIYGLFMFIVGFLGLTFLVTSGCILYFKQMDESEEERPNYTILRKLGFTQMDLVKGIQAKQLFNFGIPLVIGLCHSYFAVKSGWFFFGTELWTPMVMVMILYTALYSIFGLLSVMYYNKVIRASL